MHKKILQTTLAIATSLALFTAPHVTATEKAEPGVHVLVLGSKLKVDPRLKTELAEQGVHLHRRDIFKPLSLDC